MKLIWTTTCAMALSISLIYLYNNPPGGIDPFRSDCPCGSLERCASGVPYHPERIGR
jgi:hypothetical protein